MNPWLKYSGDPIRFVQDGLGEAVWGKQREILQSIVDNQRRLFEAENG